MMKTKIVIADDHHLVRQMLVNTLAGFADIEIVAQACNGKEAIDACRQHRPHVLVLDLNLPDISGVDVTRQLVEIGSEVRILILTAVEDERSLFESIAAGARGYLLKDASIDELVAGIKTVAADKAVLHPRSTLSLLNEFQRTMQSSKKPLEAYQKVVSSLTPREQEVLRLLGQGLSNKEIGERLVISEKTAKTHVANLLRRLGVKDRVAAAIFAVKAGFND
jgi:DNA-binding NarL/FixJ family response regulator